MPRSVVKFSFPVPESALDRGTWAIERRDRGRADPADSVFGAMSEERDH